jgi:hypothetical protein
MVVIVGEARRVVVWPGPHSNDSTLALQTLNRIGRDAKFCEGRYTIWLKYGTETRRMEPRRMEHRPEAESLEFVTARQASWIAIENLLDEMASEAMGHSGNLFGKRVCYDRRG